MNLASHNGAAWMNLASRNGATPRLVSVWQHLFCSVDSFFRPKVGHLDYKGSETIQRPSMHTCRGTYPYLNLRLRPSRLGVLAHLASSFFACHHNVHRWRALPVIRRPLFAMGHQAEKNMNTTRELATCLAGDPTSLKPC